MHARLLLAAAGILIAAPVGGAQQAPPPSPAVPSVSVAGEGEAKATPDRAMITIGVQSRASTAAEAAAENARKQRAVLDTLRALGFTQQQLTTSNYSVYPEMQHEPVNTAPRVIAYVVSNTVRVDVRRLEQAGRVIDAALAKGANTIHGLSFYLADPAPVRRAAIVDAVARARADAEALARAAGGSLGALLELSTQPMPSGPVMYRAMAEASPGFRSTPIEAGEEVVMATVNARWAFVPGR